MNSAMAQQPCMLTINADQVHIHLPSPTTALEQQQQQLPPSSNNRCSSRRSLIGRFMGRSPSSPIQQQSSNNSPGIGAGHVTIHTAATTANTNMNGAGARAPRLLLTAAPGENGQAAMLALSSALNSQPGGGIITVGQTMLRLSNAGTSAPNNSNVMRGALAPASPTTRRKPRHSSELAEHRFWLKTDMFEPIHELQRHQFYDVGRIVHENRLAVLIEEKVEHRLTLPLYIGNGLVPEPVVYNEFELRNLFRQICLAVQVLHDPKGARNGSERHDSIGLYTEFPTAHRNLHLNHILVDPVTGQVNLRGFQHAIRIDHKRENPIRQEGGHDHTIATTSSGGGVEEQKIDSFISTISGSNASNGDASYALSYFATAPLVFEDDDADADEATRRRRNRRRTYDWFAFRAPELEVDGTPHGTAVDIWSLGASLYVLLTGLPPFRGTGVDLSKAKRSSAIAPYDTTTVPTAAAQDLVRRMLVVDPAHRIRIEDVLAHAWLADESDAAIVAAVDSDLTLAQECLKDWGQRQAKK